MDGQSKLRCEVWQNSPVGSGLLELLHYAMGKVTTLDGEYRDWSQPAPSFSLAAELVGDEDGGGRAATLHWRGAGPFPRPLETRRRIRLISPDRMRVEILHNGRLERLGLLDGGRWWRWDQMAGVDGGAAALANGRWMLPPLLDPPLLTPVRLLSWLYLSDMGTGQRAGRRVISARGEPRRRSPVPGSQLHYELEFDAEHGAMLRIAAFIDQRCVQLTEAVAIEYDCRIEPALLTWPPKDVPEITVVPSARAAREGRTPRVLSDASNHGRRPKP
ncbi:MAG: hypothetical protein ACRDK7_11570 [Solirubrobacteraceae bacterium]